MSTRLFFFVADDAARREGWTEGRVEREGVRGTWHLQVAQLAAVLDAGDGREAVEVEVDVLEVHEPADALRGRELVVRQRQYLHFVTHFVVS